MIVLAMALLGAAESSTTALAPFAAAADESPRMLLLPSFGPPQRSGEAALDANRQEAFVRVFSDSVRRMLEWRHFEVVLGEEAKRAAVAAGFSDGCADEACARRIASEVGATGWIRAEVVEREDGSCRARATHYDRRLLRIVKELEATIAPCEPDELLARATELGAKVAEGARREPSVTLSLTSRSIPELELRSVPDLAWISTATRAWQADEKARALGRFEAARLMAVDEDGLFLVRRGERSVDDCALFEAAGRVVPPELATHCNGNWWELAWTALPLGLVLMAGGIGDAIDGEPGPGLLFLSGLAVAIGGPLAAHTYDRDAAEPSDHWLPRPAVRRLIGEANERLRVELGLSEADVFVGLAAR